MWKSKEASKPCQGHSHPQNGRQPVGPRDPVLFFLGTHLQDAGRCLTTNSAGEDTLSGSMCQSPWPQYLCCNCPQVTWHCWPQGWGACLLQGRSHPSTTGPNLPGSAEGVTPGHRVNFHTHPCATAPWPGLSNGTLLASGGGELPSAYQMPGAFVATSCVQTLPIPPGRKTEDTKQHAG